MQHYKQVRATHERLRVTQRALVSHSGVFYATHTSAKGVNCTTCGSEIARASKFASVNKSVSASSIASASKTASVSKSQVRVILLILITIVVKTISD